jgi:hypothetical protein
MCVSRIKLNDLSSSGVHLTPHEAVAVVHQVCNLLKVDRRGSALRAPTLDELFVTDEGEIAIEPQTEPIVRVPRRSLSQLVDELLDPDALETEKLSGGDSRMYGVQTQHRPIVRFGTTSSVNPGDERAVLRQLFDRASVERPPAIPGSSKAPTVEPIGSEPHVPVFFEAPSDVAFADQVQQSAAESAPHEDKATVSENAERFFEPSFTTLSEGRGAMESDGLGASSGELSRQRQGEAATVGTFFGERQEAVLFTGEAAEPTTSLHHEEALHREEAQSAMPDLRIHPADDIPPRMEPTTVKPKLRASRSLFVQPTPQPGRGRQVAGASFLIAAVATAVAVQWAGVMDFNGLLPGRTTGTDDEMARVLTAGLPAARDHKEDIRAVQAVDAQAPVPVEVKTREEGSSSSPATPDEIATLQTPRQSDDTLPYGDIRISPDGRWIAFVDERGEGARGIYLADRDGTNARRIGGPERATAPSWSPDSAFLAFVKAEPQRPGVWNVWVHRISNGEDRQLSSYDVGVVRSATWFPNGERLAYSHGATLVIVDIDTGSSRRIESPVPGRRLRASSVSPDGRYVAMPLEQDGVWLLEVRTGRMHRIVQDPQVSDDVKWIGRSGRLAYYRLRPDGGWRTWRGSAPTRGDAGLDASGESGDASPR